MRPVASVRLEDRDGPSTLKFSPNTPYTLFYAYLNLIYNEKLKFLNVIGLIAEWLIVNLFGRVFNYVLESSYFLEIFLIF